ncbi:MAG: hypothetical protein QOJ65_2668 [Fimbriimonadaceae bacterium]|jgi:HAD superfamily hydrolase (TIGR01509 family)|nr:hypothetical protein [Fimbriimonadaceae bacterium]
MVDAALFDVDGTLVDSVDLHAQAWQEAFSWYGKQISFLAIREQIGKGGDQLMPEFLSQEEIDSFGDELAERRTKHYLETYMPQVKAFPKVQDLLKALWERDVRVALATSAKDEELAQLKALLGANEFIVAETTKDDVQRSKPYPDIFAAALERVGNPSPVRAAVIGDSPYDAEAAGKLGVQAIGLLSGGFTAESLLNAGCKVLYRDPAELWETLESSLLLTKTKKASAHLA